jgi:hypothetical protein
MNFFIFMAVIKKKAKYSGISINPVMSEWSCIKILIELKNHN